MSQSQPTHPLIAAAGLFGIMVLTVIVITITSMPKTNDPVPNPSPDQEESTEDSGMSLPDTAAEPASSPSKNEINVIPEFTGEPPMTVEECKKWAKLTGLSANRCMP